MGDDTGLGKSAQIIAAAEVRGARRILVFCPAIGRVSWKTEFPKWQQSRPTVIVNRDTAMIPNGPVAVVVSYDAISRRAGYQRVAKLLQNTEPFDVFALDEAHYLKNPEANRTRAIYGARMDLRSGLIAAGLATDGVVWPASATPQKTNAVDLFPHIRALFPDVLLDLFGTMPTRNQFVERYCTFYDGLYGREITGNNPATIGELVDKLRQYFIVRRKADVAQELGAINHVTLPLEIPERNKNKLDILDEGHEGDRTKYLDLLENLPVDAPLPEPPAHLMQLWRELGEAKVEPGVAWIRDFLDADPSRKLVVFAHHRTVIEQVAAAFPGESVRLYGGTAQKDRESAVQQFQENPSVRLFVGQTLAAGTSITLTAAADVLVLEPEFAALDMYQAISRCHRIGQTQPVTAFYAYADDTVDRRIARTVQRRTSDFENLMAGLTRH